MDRDLIKKIIDAGNLAPSGGNSQPWKFSVTGSSITVTLLPEKDHPVLNFKNRGTLVALGALIENISIAAQSLGYKAEWQANLPKNEVKITLTSTNKIENTKLAEAISKRHTNRKDFKKDPLTQAENLYLFQEVNKFPECELIVIEKEKVAGAAKHLAIDILIFLQNKVLHKLLFQEILWKEHHQHTRGGLFIKTMEAVPPKSFVMKLMSNWKIAKFFGKLKLHNKIHEENSNKAASSALIGAIVVKDTDESFIHAGRLLENIWLRSAELDLGFQLVSGVLFLRQQVKQGSSGIFSETEKQLINTAYDELAEILNVKHDIIALTFRIGKAKKPLAVSHKRPAEITWA